MMRVLSREWLPQGSVTVTGCDVVLQVPAGLRSSGGKWRVCCKAFNVNGDTQVRVGHSLMMQAVGHCFCQYLQLEAAAAVSWQLGLACDALQKLSLTCFCRKRSQGMSDA